MTRTTSYWPTAGGALRSRVSDAVIPPPPPPPVGPTAVIRVGSKTDLTANLTASGSTAKAPATIVSYSWTFGDGKSDTGVNVSHTYASPGTYDVVLQVLDSQGLTGTSKQQVIVTAPVVVNQKPTITFKVTGQDLTATIDLTGTADPDGTLRRLDFVWGDGGASSRYATDPGGLAFVQSHDYAVPGKYTLSAVAYDDQNATATASGSFTAVAPNVGPVARFTATESGMTVHVDASASSDSDGTIVRYLFGWGDGTPNTEGKIQDHTYAGVGPWTIALSAYDNDGVADTTTQQVSVQTPVPAGGDDGLGTNNGLEPKGYTSYSTLSGANVLARAKAAGTAKMSLPPGTLPLPGFTSNAYATQTSTGGLIGAGSAKTTLSQVANTSSGATPPSSGTNAWNLIRSETANALFQDFKILGTAQSMARYNGLMCHQSSPTVRRVKLVAAAPGNDKAPPGETFGLNFFGSSGGLVEDVEIDGNGTGASGFATNSWTGPLQVTRLYSHDNWYSGAIALWQTKGGVTFDDCVFDQCRCFWNIERCSDTITLNRPRIGTLKAAPSGWASGTPSGGVGIFTESDATWGQAASRAFRFLVKDPRNLDGTPYSGPKITVNFGSANDGGTNYYGRDNFKAYDKNGTDISASFFSFGGKPYV